MSPSSKATDRRRQRSVYPGRPSKRTPEVTTAILQHLAKGESRRRTAQHVGVDPKTMQRWLRTTPDFRRLVLKAEKKGAPYAAYLRWLHHPFRGRRPPLPAAYRHLPRPRPRFAY
jgi:hypothetical protein